MPAGTQDPWDPESEDFRAAVQEMQEVTVVGAMGAALPNRAAKWTHHPAQGMFTQTPFKEKELRTLYFSSCNQGNLVVS